MRQANLKCLDAKRKLNTARRGVRQRTTVSNEWAPRLMAADLASTTFAHLVISARVLKICIPMHAFRMSRM